MGASNDPLELEAEPVLAAPVHPDVIGAPPSIQRYTGQATEGKENAPASVDRVLANPGSPLEPALRQDMEQRFGYDFSQVRVHSGAAAEQSALDVNAHAYTVGHNIVFGAGQYSPRSIGGQHLLAHELAHVVQQKGQGNLEALSRKQSLSTGEPAERNGDAAAEHIVSSASIVRLGTAPVTTLLRQQAPAASTTSAARTGTSAPNPPQSRSAERARAQEFQPEVWATDIDLGRFSRFYSGRADARLNRRMVLTHAQQGVRGEAPPCQLDLFLKLHFDFHLGPSAYRQGPMGEFTQPGTPWPADRARQWKFDYMRVAQDTWHTRHPLEKTDNCPSEPCSRAVGQLRVIDADTMTDSEGHPALVGNMSNAPHFTVHVYDSRPWAGRQESRVGGSESTMYAEDVLPRGTPPPPGFNQDLYHWQPGAASHETGHMLGRPHINCAPDNDKPNEERCYGVTDVQRANVMGRGGEFGGADHAPFLAAMRATTGCEWRVPSGGLPWWAILLISLTGVGAVVLGIMALAGAL